MEHSGATNAGVLVKSYAAYHGENDPAKELFGRLLYEYVFDFVDESHRVEGKWWIGSQDHQRDQGHVFRLRKFAAISGIHRIAV
jgi:hypothetical protein